MELGSILVLLALAIMVVGYILQPIFEKRTAPITEDNRLTSELQAERDQVLMNLQEFDLDYAMGKIPKDEYEKRRTALVARGAAILKALDGLGGMGGAIPADAQETLDQEGQDLDAQIENEIQERRRSVKDEIIGFCPQCGNKVHSGDRFCTKCGHKVAAAEAET